MSRSAWSTRFIGYTSATPNTSFEVPTGFVAVIRQISCSVTAGEAGWQVYTQDDADAYGIVVAQGLFDGAQATDSQEGRWWCPAGGIITLIATSYGDGFNAYVGGYLLTNSGSPLGP